MARPIIHHRTPEFSAVLDRARTLMQPLFGTRQDVILLTASGTGAMEAAVTNLLAPGDHALFVQASETSTCAIHPIAEIGALTRGRDVLLIVDGITSVGVFEQKMDDWG